MFPMRPCPVPRSQPGIQFHSSHHPTLCGFFEEVAEKFGFEYYDPDFPSVMESRLLLP